MVNDTSLVKMWKMSFGGPVIFFRYAVSVLKKKSYVRGKVYSLKYYSVSQAEYEKLNTISWNVWNTKP